MKSMTYSKTVPFSIDFSFFSFFLYRRAHIEIDAKRKKYGRRVPSGDRSITDYWTWCAYLAAVFPIELRCFGSSSSFIIRKMSYLLVIFIGLVVYHTAKVWTLVSLMSLLGHKLIRQTEINKLSRKPGQENANNKGVRDFLFVTLRNTIKITTKEPEITIFRINNIISWSFPVFASILHVTTSASLFHGLKFTWTALLLDHLSEGQVYISIT